MKTSSDGRRAIMQREGVRLRAYKDGGGVWTIGVGHTSAAGVPMVTSGALDISRHEAEAILSRDLEKFEHAVLQHVHVPLEQFQFDALVSFVFNIGEGAFAKSTLLRKLNTGDYHGAADQFPVWNKDNGKTVKGLVTRRASERAQFLGAL